MSEPELVQISNEGAIRILTLNNPPRLNAYSADMRGALLRAMTEAMEDDAVRAIVLTGAGGNFSAGGDLTSRNFDPAKLLDARDIPRESQALLRAMVSGPKAVISAVEGYAYGAGMALAAASDYVVAALNAKFSAAFIRVGLVPDVSIFWSLAQRVGPGRAKELLLLGTPVEAAEAHSIGLASKVVEPGTALNAALEVAKTFAAGPPVAQALIKAAFFNGMPTIADAWRAEIDYVSAVWQTKDFLEGRNAFLEKRKPVFKGE